MGESQADKSVVREIVLSLTAGTSITLLLAILRAAQIMPDTADLLLRPGPYLANKLGVTGLGALFLSVLGDGIVYGSLPFVMMRARSPRNHLHHPPSPSLHLRHLDPQPERRRAPRLPLSAEVLIYGWLKGEPFAENTETLNVSDLGGLMPVQAKLIRAQTLLLINAKTNAEMRCNIARATNMPDGKTMIGVEFAESSNGFWQADTAVAAQHAPAHPHA